MSDLQRQLHEDRALRNAALALVKADVENVKQDLSGKKLATRAIDRLTDGASEIFEEASEIAADNKGILAGLIGAIVIWFARHPIFEALGLGSGTQEAPGAEPEHHRGRS